MYLMAGLAAIVAEGFLTKPAEFSDPAGLKRLNFAAHLHGDIPPQLRDSDRILEAARRD
jgi:hypothetical protein